MLFTFIVIAVVCGGLSLIGLIIGGIGEASVDVGHDVGHDYDHGGWYSWLSIKVISAFGTAFGASGAIALQYVTTTPWAIPIAIFSGVVVGYGVKSIVGYLNRQEVGAAYRAEDLKGKTGVVTLGILENGIGEVQFMLNNQAINVPSRSADGKEISQGTSVVVVEVGSVLSVKKQ